MVRDMKSKKYRKRRNRKYVEESNSFLSLVLQGFFSPFESFVLMRTEKKYQVCQLLDERAHSINTNL